MEKHKVFISYHHEKDEEYKIEFERKCKDFIINQAVQFGEYNDALSDEYVKRLIREEKITDCSVVVVLIGAETYKRKHVDWEIYAGISGKAGGRSGLIGILLPTYYDADENNEISNDEYNKDTIPPRLQDNIETGYAEIYDWDYAFSQDENGNYYIENLIDDAFKRKNDNNIKTDNSREQFKNNRC